MAVAESHVRIGLEEGAVSPVLALPVANEKGCHEGEEDDQGGGGNAYDGGGGHAGGGLGGFDQC